jgi:enoyl-CoA hydratase/carnithine racemase
MHRTASPLPRSIRIEPMLATEQAGRVVIATLARPPVNALDGELIARLDAVVDQVSADPEIAVLHIRSDQTSFCAGADLALMRSCFATSQGRGAMVDVVRSMQRLFRRLESAAVVTLAEIGGAAIGGGLELALACDLRVAAVDAMLGLSEVRLGLIPAAGGTQRLTRLCGRGTAKRLILGAELIDGAEALRLGIVQWVQPREKLAGWTRELAARLGRMPKAALVASKHCIHAEGDPSRDGFAEEITATRSLYDDPETVAKVSEFLNKRHPIVTKESP